MQEVKDKLINHYKYSYHYNESFLNVILMLTVSYQNKGCKTKNLYKNIQLN